MADEDRLILSTAFDLTGAVGSLKQLQVVSTTTGGQIERAIGDQAATGITKTERAALRLAAAEQKVALASADHAGKVQILQSALAKQNAGSVQYLQTQERLIRATQALDRVQQQAAARQIADQSKVLREQQRIAAQQERATRGSSGQAVLPRSFGGFTGGGLLQAAGALGVVTSVTEIVAGAKQLADAGREINVSIDGARKSLGGLLDDTSRGDAIFQKSSEFARRYGFTQLEAAQATASAADIFRTSHASVEKILEVQARLASRNQEEGIRGAAYAIRELNTGDIQSIVDRFNISRPIVNAWKAEIQGGADVVDVLDRGLAKLGITEDDLALRTTGATGAQNNQNVAIEDLQRRLGNLVQSSGWVQFQTALTKGATAGLGFLSGDIGLNSVLDQFNKLKATGNFDGPTGSFYAFGLAIGAANEESLKLLGAQEDLAQVSTAVAASVQAINPSVSAYGIAVHNAASVSGTFQEASGMLATEIARVSLAMAQAEAAAKPYKDALDDAQSTVDGLTGQLKDAQAEFDHYANAQTQGEADFVKRRRALALESAQAALDLLNFEHGGGLDAVLAPTVAELDTAKAGLGGFEDAVSTAEDAVTSAEDAVRRAEAGLRPYEDALDAAKNVVTESEHAYDDAADAMAGYDQAVESAKRNLDDQNDALQESKDYLDEQNTVLKETEDRYKAVEDAINAQYGALRDWQNKELLGTDTYRQATQAVDDRMLAARQNINHLQRSGADDDTINRAREALDKLRLEKESIELAMEADIGRAQRELEDRARMTEEVSVGDAQTGIDSAKTEIERLNGMVPAHQAAIDAQKEGVASAQSAVDAQAQAVADATTALENATEGQRLYQVQLDNARIAIEKQKEQVDLASAALDTQKEKVDIANTALSEQKRVLDIANDALGTQKDRISELGDQLDTTRTEALAPYKAAVDDLGLQAETLDLREKLELVPLRDEINDLKDPIVTLPFDVIIAGMQTSGEKVAYLSDQLLIANGKLAEAKTAYENAQTPVATFRDTIADLKLKQDELKTAQDLAATATTKSIQPTKDAAAATNEEAAAIERKNRALTEQGGMGSSAGRKRGNDSGTGSGGYNPQAIDTILKGTGLAGQGGNIAAFAEQYKVPAELALAMFRKEASFLTAGSSVANNNPGNIVYTGGAYGEDRRGNDGRFGHYATVKGGIEAYFQLLNREYRDFIDSGNIDDLITKYAPPFENDTGMYQSQIAKWMADYAASIVQKAATTATGTRTRGSVGQPGDPVLTDAAVDVIIPGGKQNDSYNARRDMNSDGDMTDAGDVHAGLDIGGAAGSAVKTPVGGRVVFAAPNQWGGTAVIIEDAQGLQWYYGHLRGDIKVAAGENVDAQDVLGYIDAQFMHTHLQVRNAAGSTVDPTQILEAMAAGRGAGAFPDQFSAQANAPTDPRLSALSPENTRFLIELLEQLRQVNPTSPLAPIVSDLEAIYDIGDPRYESIIGDIAGPVEEQVGKTKVSLDELKRITEEYRDGTRTFAGGLLGTGEFANTGDTAGFGGGGGGGFGSNDPSYGSVTGDLAGIGKDLGYGISDPIGESLIKTSEDTDALKGLFDPSQWSDPLASNKQVWETFSMDLQEQWRIALDYARSAESLLADLAASSRLSAESVGDAVGSVPSGGGAAAPSGGPAPATTTNIYTTNIRTENPRRYHQSARARGRFLE